MTSEFPWIPSYLSSPGLTASAAVPARHHHLVEARGVLDGFGREAIQRYPPVELVAPRQGAVGERFGEDDHVSGARARVGHHGLILLPQGDAPGTREVSLMAASDGAKAAPPGRLIGEQELHRHQPRSHGPAAGLVPDAIHGKRLAKMEDVPFGAARVIEHLRWVVQVPAPPEQPVKIADQ